MSFPTKSSAWLTTLLFAAACGSSDDGREARADAGLSALFKDATAPSLHDSAPPATTDSGGNDGCPSGQSRCGGDCFDLTSNPSHCGHCGNRCEEGSLCAQGSCAQQTGDCRQGASCPVKHFCDLNSGQCEPGCAGDDNCPAGTPCNKATRACCGAGEAVCADRCVNLMLDTTHCGSCTNACPRPAGTTAVCSAGSCGLTCAAGQTLCGQQCATLASDLSHCGSCNQPCVKPTGGSASCQAGKCVKSCPAGKTDCGGKCVDTLSDPQHCSACGKACTASTGTAVCKAGSCSFECGPDETLCGSTCRQLDIDPDNCGSCGKQCFDPGFGDRRCLAGECKPQCWYLNCDGQCCNTDSYCCQNLGPLGPYKWCQKNGAGCY